MIRRARIADFDAVAAILRLAWEDMESSLKDTMQYDNGYDEQVAATWLRRMLNDYKSAVFVMERDGEVVGAVGGAIFPIWFRLTDAAVQLFAYVLPTHRGSGFALIREFERWGSRWGSVSRVIAGVESEDAIPLYERLGYRVLNTNLSKEV